MLTEQEREHGLHPQAVRRRIAASLDVTADALRLDCCDLSPSRWSLRCRGSCNGKRFFSKTYLLDPYPVHPRFAVPWEDPPEGSQLSWPAAYVMEKEWNRTNQFRKVAEAFIPMALGMSERAKTVVWEEVQGVRLDRLASRSRFPFGATNTFTAALYQAGIWLKKVHSECHSGEESLNLRALVETLRVRMDKEAKQSPAYARRALAALEKSLLNGRGGTTLKLPVALTHGDFVLTNLLWDKRNNQLYVFDFEHSEHRNICHDLGTIVFDLRIRLLNPFISRRAIRLGEESFWAGYGAISPEMFAVVEAVALCRIFHYYLPRVSRRGERAGWWAGATTALYQALLQDLLITRTLGFRGRA